MHNKKNKQKQAGFSLIEVLISIAIFSVIVSGILLFSVRTIEAHTKSQAMQNSLENARFAIEKINKKVRTSSGVTDDDGDATQFQPSDEIFFIDNVDHTKHCYKFNADKLEVSITDPDSDALDCSHGDFSVFTTLIGSASGKVKIDGDFFVKQTDLVSAIKRRGFVRTVITIKYNDASGIVTEKDSVTIQSGVALRDY